MFTCVTDTGRLVWAIINHNNRHSFHSPEKINISVLLNIFTLTLLSVTDTNTYQSTAVAHNITVDYNATDVNKQKSAMPPSYVQSLNSTHMMLTSFYSKRSGTLINCMCSKY